MKSHKIYYTKMGFTDYFVCYIDDQDILLMNTCIPKAAINEIVDIIKDELKMDLQDDYKLDVIELDWEKYQDMFEKALDKLDKLGLKRKTFFGQDPSNTKH